MDLHEKVSLYSSKERVKAKARLLLRETRVEHGPSLDHQNLGII